MKYCGCILGDGTVEAESLWVLKGWQLLRPKGVHLCKFWMFSLPAREDIGTGADKSELSGPVMAPLGSGL